MEGINSCGCQRESDAMKAALVIIDWNTGETMHTFFGGKGCVSECRALWESIKDDWPMHKKAVITDDEAQPP